MQVFDISSTYTPLVLPPALYSVHCGRGENSFDILEIFGGFDTETTNIYQIDGWAAYVYHFQIALTNQRETYVYLFREWEVFLHFIDEIVNYYDLGESRKLILWVANFSFEFQFLRERLEWDSGEWDFFAKEERQPLKASYHGLEFREALTISGGDLAHLARAYCKTQKLVTYDEDGVKHSDLDYTVERNFATPLTEQERAYVINDVVILAEFSQYMFNEYIRPLKKVPMTKTSILLDECRRELKQLCKDRDEKHHLELGESLAEWLSYIRACQPTEEQYKIWFDYLFKGGYVHANALYTDIECMVNMRDVTSMYPAHMLLSYVPVTPFKKVQFSEDLLKIKCLIMRVQYDFIEATTPHSIESKNKVVYSVGAVWDNGRLVSCDALEVWQTEKDFEIFNLFYRSKTGQPPTVVECYEAERGELPPYVTDGLKKYYIKKNHLKRSGMGDSQEYSVIKTFVNTFYGMLVKRIRLQKITYSHGWGTETKGESYEKEIEKLILLPQWGIWCTSQSRYTLLTTLYKLTKAGVQCCYCDTDSIKYLPSHRAEQIFKHFNNTIRRRLHNRGLRDENFKDLGMFDIEIKDKATGRPVAVRFKTLGAKRYIYEKGGKVIATVSGMPKQSINRLGESVEEIFRNFNHYGYNLKPEISGKLTTRYRDEPHEALVGFPFEKMHELTSVALYQIPFTMTLGGEYISYFKEQQILKNHERRYL